MLSNLTDDRLLWGILAVLLVLVAVVGKRASAGGVELNTDAGYKRPMLAFEMNARAAPVIFKSWNEVTKDRLRTALLWDYVFIFLYPAAIAVACFISGRFLDSRGILAFKYSLIVMSLQLIAGMFDAGENFALLRVLRGPIESPWPQMARWCALFKFSIVIMGVLYVLIIGGGAWLITGIARLVSH